MSDLKRLGMHLLAASELDMPPELLAYVLTTSHAGRLREMFQGATRMLLESHKEVQQRPHSAFSLHERARRKYVVDLIRARVAMIGARKPQVEKMLGLILTPPSQNIVTIKKAA